MKINVLVINTNIIQGEDLEAVIIIARDDYNCPRLPTRNHYLLCAVADDDVEDILSEIEALNLSNPAYEITVRNINSQLELDMLSLILEAEPR